MSHDTECLQCGELDPCDGHICGESKSIQRREALQVPKRMSDSYFNVLIENPAAWIPELKGEVIRARANEKRLEIILDTEREEGERLRQWEQTIILSPGDAREIALKRFRESDFARDIVEVWRKENADLKARVKELEKPAGK